MDQERIAHCLALSRLARGQQGEAQAATLAELEAALWGMQPACVAPLPGAELMLNYAGYLSGWSEGAEQLFGYSASEALGQQRGEFLARRKNGELFPQAATVGAVRGEDGPISHTFTLFSDIGVHQDTEERMQRLANYDALTGLPNQGLLLRLLGQAMTEARRKQEHGALLVIEINRLGAIGDTLGHEVSNSVLLEAGRIFRMVLRDEDILARLDGGKFAAALPQIEKREHAAIVAQKLIAALEAPLTVGLHSLQLSAHVGTNWWRCACRWRWMISAPVTRAWPT
ncbi:diguanylate cyclase domain-containing protein [Pseudoduganella sp. HUAS MS19]